MKTTWNMTNTTLREVWTWHYRSKNRKVTQKIGLKFYKVVFCGHIAKPVANTLKYKWNSKIWKKKKKKKKKNGKKETLIQAFFQNFWKHLFYRTALDDCFYIGLNWVATRGWSRKTLQ